MISEANRPSFLQIRALTTDEQGREVFVGLSYEESLEYVALVESRLNTDEAFRRHNELYAKHETARLHVIFAENEARVTKPTMN